MARALAERRWFAKNQPQTLQIAVVLLYWNALLSLLSGLIGLHFGPLVLISLLVDLLGAFGVANERKIGYYVAVVASVLPFVGLLLPLFGGSSYFGAGVLTLIFDVALVVLLLHPISRGYFKVWFR